KLRPVGWRALNGAKGVVGVRVHALRCAQGVPPTRAPPKRAKAYFSRVSAYRGRRSLGLERAGARCYYPPPWSPGQGHGPLNRITRLSVESGRSERETGGVEHPRGGPARR